MNDALPRVFSGEKRPEIRDFAQKAEKGEKEAKTVQKKAVARSS
jgi:hypothetical protein